MRIITFVSTLLVPVLMTGVDLELYVRSLAPASGEPDRTELVEQVRAAADQSGGTADVVVWGRAIPLDSDHPLADRLARFREWATDTGARLVGVEEHVTGSLADEKRPVIGLPTVMLAEYRDGELVAVTPHERDGALRTVADHLGGLALDASPRTEEKFAASD